MIRLEGVRLTTRPVQGEHELAGEALADVVAHRRIGQVDDAKVTLIGFQLGDAFELEAVDFGPGLGVLEAFLTAGGVSTMPYEYEGRVASMTYKTLRYPGHAALMRAIRDLGTASSIPAASAGFTFS